MDRRSTNTNIDESSLNCWYSGCSAERLMTQLPLPAEIALEIELKTSRQVEKYNEYK